MDFEVAKAGGEEAEEVGRDFGRADEQPFEVLVVG